jgi:hypothetical protein
MWCVTGQSKPTCRRINETAENPKPKGTPIWARARLTCAQVATILASRMPEANPMTPA